MKTLALLLLSVASAAIAALSPIWQDDFDAPMRYEVHGPRCWTLGDGVALFRVGDAEARLVALTPAVSDCVVESELSLAERTAGGWSYAGIGLLKDPVNHWQLMLVEGPDGQRYPELIEKLNGEHQAQLGVGSIRARLESTDTGDLATWDSGRRYLLRLALDSEGIEGTITDVESGQFWQRRFSFARGIAVKSGRPYLIAHGKRGSYAYLRAEADLTAQPDALAIKPGERTAAIVQDSAGTVAGPLAAALERAGFTVTLVDWPTIETRTLPPKGLDLLVLADARRVPVGAKTAVMTALQTSGKVMAVGAPAFSELTFLTPEGWRGQGDWTQAFAAQLERTPLQTEAGDWSRSAMNLERESSFAPDPSAGEGAWKFETDLQGWDTVYTAVGDAFAEDRELLVFDAKSEGPTGQMVVELVEDDKSRWITSVDITGDWRTYVLRPADFPYWEDSAARGRGFAGDKVRPGHVLRISLGIASSHNSKVEPGHNAFWIRNLSTAQDPGLPAPDFSISDVQSLCPSYMLYPVNEAASIAPAGNADASRTAWTGECFSPVWRERGRGLNRGRSWRWVPVLEAFDASGRQLGAPLSCMVGDGTCPNAVWANVAVADPVQALDPRILGPLTGLAVRMADGHFLLEGGAELFSYLPGETVELGAQALNVGRAPADLTVEVDVRDASGARIFEAQETLAVDAGTARKIQRSWKPDALDRAGYEVTVRLLDGEREVDRISHRIEALRSEPAGPEEFVRVEGSRFMLGDEPWYFKGINYRPGFMAGYPHLNLIARECYDPEIIERELDWMQEAGMNAISAIHALMPPNPESPLAYRDQLDFLERCDRHGMKLFFIVPHGRPYQGENVYALMNYIQNAGIKDHPAIMCWELAWEPIEGPWQGKLDFILEDWNRWIVQRYGSIAAAVADWGFDPREEGAGKVPVPTVEQCRAHGDWDVYVAAFRRAFSDLISARYRDIARPLREWDPKHLISFRGGACGIPHADRFAHIHSAGASKHMDFLNPEGYNLQTGGWAKPTPPDDIRKGGLVTLYYRYASREKPIVWMEFGFTVNGFHREWQPDDLFIDPEKLRLQAQEYEAFYSMFIESGARGAAPWWLPGGFRLGENSDFGILEPDGSERPAAKVVRKYLPLFDTVQHPAASRIIEIDLDASYPDSWPLLSDAYLAAVQAGQVPGLITAGNGTSSADCPLVAVGNVPCNGHNPPIHLNAEFNAVELKIGDGDWQRVRDGEVIDAPRGASVMCRASVGNLGEAKWLAPQNAPDVGGVYLAGRAEYGMPFAAPIAADAPYLSDAEVLPFALVQALGGEQSVSFEMLAAGRVYFGERLTVTIRPGG